MTNQIQSVDYRTIFWAHTYDPATRRYTGENIRPVSFNDPLQDLPSLTGPDNWPERLDAARTQYGLVQPLSEGWDTSRGGTLDVEPLAAGDVDGAIATRRRQVELWEAAGATDPRYLEVARTMRDVWQLNDGQEPVRPQWKANMGYRRSYAMAGVFTLRRIRATDGDWDASFMLWVKLAEYGDTQSRLMAHLTENERTGSSPLDPVDHLAFADQLFRAFGTEADLVRGGIKRGTAQKLARWVKLARKWSGLDLIGRALQPAPILERGERYEYTPGGWVPFKRVDKEETKKLLDGDPKTGAPPAASEDAVEDGLIRMFGGRVNTPKMLSREAIENAKDGNPSQVVRDLSAAILDPQAGGKVLERLSSPRNASIMNAAYSLLSGKLPDDADARALVDAWRLAGGHVEWITDDEMAAADARNAAAIRDNEPIPQPTPRKRRAKA